ncbi:hypothetical protein MKW98_032376 [Papaver atlanticum]|uniref:Uncharacterized protein n=1 Tax=Papaver atlanticum TaxID=357466 RepID=A0AAD4X4Q5_9MAGN|nr:hypothetical protein MKW98_032376 [Papaver atlanticum]
MQLQTSVPGQQAQVTRMENGSNNGSNVGNECLPNGRHSSVVHGQHANIMHGHHANVVLVSSVLEEGEVVSGSVQVAIAKQLQDELAKSGAVYRSAFVELERTRQRAAAHATLVSSVTEELGLHEESVVLESEVEPTENFDTSLGKWSNQVPYSYKQSAITNLTRTWNSGMSGSNSNSKKGSGQDKGNKALGVIKPGVGFQRKEVIRTARRVQVIIEHTNIKRRSDSETQTFLFNTKLLFPPFLDSMSSRTNFKGNAVRRGFSYKLKGSSSCFSLHQVVHLLSFVIPLKMPDVRTADTEPKEANSRSPFGKIVSLGVINHQRWLIIAISSTFDSEI